MLGGLFHASEIYVDELQWHMCPDGAQRGLWYSPLKDAAMLATLYQSSTVLNHHGPPESFLCED